MLFISAQYLKPGMILARDLPSEYFGLSLVVRGQRLTDSVIRKLTDLGLGGAYVESTVDSDMMPDETIPPELQKKLLLEVKKLFENCALNAEFSDELINNAYRVSAELVTSVLSRREVILNISNIKSYDDYTYNHSMMVGLVSTLIGVRLGLTEHRLNELAVCGLMHDLGKVDIPLEIINKPTALTDEEFEIVRNHPANALRRLRGKHPCSPAVLQGIASHHEKYDGSGYPDNLQGEQIPLYGRILALADVFDALTSRRSYRESWTPEQAIEYMMGLANTHFDYTLLHVFLSVIAAYPVGCILRLSNGYTCVVTHNTPGMTLRPTLRVLEPPILAGTDIDLATDIAYLNVTVSKIITDTSALSEDLFRS